MIPDPVSEDGVYVAESAGTVKRVSLSRREVTRTFTGPAAPISCIHIRARRASDGTIQQTLFGGCWDKNIWEWKIPQPTDSTATTKSERQYSGHTDFVKALETLELPGISSPILISGGAEKEIILWNTSTGARLHVLKGHLRGILDLKWDPTTIFPGSNCAILYTASSSREIRICRIPLPSSSSTANGTITSDLKLKSLELSGPLNVHETSVFALHFDSDGDLWTASADKTAKHLSRAVSKDDGLTAIADPQSEWEIDTTLSHPDFVRAIVSHPTLGWVITGCRDEEVRVWNTATSRLEHTYTGHHEEVTGLTIRGTTVVSVSIDGTIRTWNLSQQEIQAARQQAEASEVESGSERQSTGKKGGVDLTEEEERELAELMAED